MYHDLGEMVETVSRTHGDDVAFQIRRGLRMERTTFRQSGNLARQIAGWLLAQGLAPGDRIIVWSTNMPEYAVLFLGAWLAGIVVVPIDVRTKPDALERFVRTARPRIGFISSALSGDFGPPVESTWTIENLFDLSAGSTLPERHPAVNPEDLAEIAFTSGTTGVPKGVMLTHRNFISELESLRQAFPLDRHYRALSLLPLSHIYEQTINLLHGYSSGIRMTYLTRVNAATIARAMYEEHITCVAVVPALLSRLLAAIERRVKQERQWQRYQAALKLADYLPFPLRRMLFRRVHQALGGKLVFFGCGGAPLDLKAARTWERIGIRVFEGYGLTETTAGTTLNTWNAARLGSAGRAVPNISLRIGGEGEILIQGPQVTPGYYEDPERTANSILDGWFRTGDVGAVDSGGFLRITGRVAFRIVLANGQNVYPEDIEQVLNQHPLVTESCVVGLPDEGGETVHAVLLTEFPDRVSEAIRDTNRLLASHQQIMGSTVWTADDFPRTPTLKADRKIIRQSIERRQTTAAGLLAIEAPPADPITAIIVRLARCPSSAVTETAELGTDLGLDSLGRVELLAAIEEELGRVVDELKVGPQTQVADLRRLVDAGASQVAEPAPARWPRAAWAAVARRFLLWLAFRLQDRWMRIEIVHPERAAVIPVPSILIFNYQGPYVPLLMLRALPRRLRSRVATAADSRLWAGRERWQGMLLALGGQAFPIAKSGGAVRAGLTEVARWLDDGYAVIFSPEGNPEQSGQPLPFLGGTGLMAVEMGVPVVPFRIEHYHRLFPANPKFPYLPNRKGRVRLTVGEPLTFSRTMSPKEATDKLQRALFEAL